MAKRVGAIGVGKVYTIPYISKNHPNGFSAAFCRTGKALKVIQIALPCGAVFYAIDIKDEYRYDERIEVIRAMRRYMHSVEDLEKPNKELQAYCALLWHLFGDYLDAYSFHWCNPGASKGRKSKHLYILSNSLGFIKVGVSSNVKARIVDLKYEFGGEWEILKIYPRAGAIEKALHRKLVDYTFPVKHRHTGVYSQECFLDCQEVRQTCLNLSI